MSPMNSVPRRQFLKLAGAAAIAGASGKTASAASGKIGIVVKPGDAIAASQPVAWAIGKLRQALTEKGTSSEILSTERQAKDSRLIIVVSGTAEPVPGISAPSDFPSAAESLRIAPGKIFGAPALLVSARDVRGLVYGLLELADRVECSTDSSVGLEQPGVVEESPANRVRSVARAFCSEIEDKAWFYDKDFWRGYLDMLAMQRFNRFNFAFGFGYDFPRGVTGDYFHFLYPYLVEVPGYDVRVVPLPDGERARNLEMLQFIVAETAARGIQFQLGIWTHAYAWVDSPHSDHHIEGLTAETHAPYCRDALAMLLKLCPQIEGLTLRVHGESGIPEGSYPFWETLFEAVAKCGRTVEIDMHAKGINQIMIDMAAKTGMPVKVGAKSWAEHMGLGYHQADIRELEIPRPDRVETGLFAVSNGERRFTRYGYADLFQEGRKFDVLFRLWPGTQRHLVWGDPEMAAGYGRTAHFCNAAGLEICEPLTFKGREGSGNPGGRCAYVEKSLQPGTGDWRKFEYTYRVWGRLLYNPDSSPDVWQRHLRKQFGAGAAPAEASLANASRVLPLLTTAHLPSASNHSFWPEMYADMAMVADTQRPPYTDSPRPIRFGTVSPLDPQIFSSIAECIDDLLGAQTNPKYSPLEVAQWMENFAGTSESQWNAARKQFKGGNPQARIWEEDLLIQIGLARFFAAKLRSGLLFEIQQKTGSSQAGQLAISKFTEARQAWATMAYRAKNVYVADLSYGSIPQRRGHWVDRLPEIDRDLETMRTAIAAPPASADDAVKAKADLAMRLISGKVERTSVDCLHETPARFAAGKPLTLSLRVKAGGGVSGGELYYRHVNQGERWRSIPMQTSGADYSASIPGDYTDSPYPLQYYFAIHGRNFATLYPGFNAALSNQPYYSVWQRSS